VQKKAVQKLIGAPTAAAPSAKTHRGMDRSRKSVLFVAGGEPGLGNLACLLAIAENMKGQCEPIFASFGPPAGIAAGFGYRSESVSAQAATADRDLVDDWVRAEIDELLNAYAPNAVVFAGPFFSKGILGAATARPGCPVVWVRLSGDRRNADAAAAFVDLVVEADEMIAADPVEEESYGFKRVGPIRLVEPSGQLPAAEAAEALKLDRGRPAVLLQLGAGDGFDAVDALNHIVHRIEPTGAQIAVVESPEGVSAVFLPPSVRRLRGFPVSRYYQAFDFSIAVPSYSVFNEAVALGLPSIFVLTDESRSDEAQRAKHAQDAGAALMVALKDLKDIGAMAHVLLSKQACSFLSKNCTRITRPNGAPEAARAILEVAWRSSMAGRPANGG
jgi:hypothetical protein